MNRAAPRAWNRTLNTSLAGVRAIVFGAFAVALLAQPLVPSLAQDADPVVAKVDGVEVRESDRSARRAKALAEQEQVEPRFASDT